MKAVLAWASPVQRPISILRGFRLTLGLSLVWLAVIVLLPLSAVFVRGFDEGWRHFAEVAFSARAWAAYQLSFGAALLAAAINAVLGLLLAYVLVRRRFPGRALVDALVDLPIALPTAVAGIALSALHAQNGWIGQWLAPLGLDLAFSPAGVVLALVFIGLPFVVRTLQPVLEDLGRSQEEAALSLGASRVRVFLRVVLPAIAPAWLTGVGLAFARAVGEYGSVIFIAGNMPYRSEIAPLLIVIQLEQYDYAGAAAIAVVMLVLSFLLLLGINALQAWQRRRQEGVA